MESTWIICPVCHGKTHTKIRKDTKMSNFPLFCHKCKQESLIDVQDGYIKVKQRARHEMQSR